MIRILTVDDSRVMELLLKALFDKEPDMQVVGHAFNGLEAVEMAKKLKPDVITMDIRMPVMDGFEATSKIMTDNPVPIIVFSAVVDDPKLKESFKALEKGAAVIIEKPHNVSDPSFETLSQDLIATARALAKSKNSKKPLNIAKVKPAPKSLAPKTRKGAYEVVGLGVSTGGPITLRTILSGLPKEFPLPVVVVQHMFDGFVVGFVDWIKKFTKLKVELAKHGGRLESGVIYIAPDNQHLMVARRADNLFIKLTALPKGKNFCPSVDVLFDSLANSCPGSAIGGLLTGMGDDGAKGLLAMHDSECHTFVEAKEDCVIDSMVSEAIDLNACNSIVPLNEIATHILDLVCDIKGCGS
jgi:two-component system, chemotaxis family, protein-glutamate methylesterase/glutaminase